jgi:phosphate transport system substrate-binding protein
MRPWAWLAIGAALALPGCAPKISSKQPDQDLTSGSLLVVCSPEARDVMERSRETFMRLYPNAHVDLQSGTSQDAIAALFGARAQLAVITRELLPEERRAAVQGKLEVEGYPFARDAAVLLVRPDNPVQNLTVEDVRDIYLGKVHDWSELGGRHEAIVPIVPPATSDLMAFFVQKVMDGDPIAARSITAASDSEVVRAVLARPGAIGITTLGATRLGGRALNLAALKGLPYATTDLEAVHDGRYPVTRFYNMYVRSAGPPVADGFITFVTSFDGQKLVKDSGLVPTTVPVRFVRRSPMLATHSKGDSVHTP